MASLLRKLFRRKNQAPLVCSVALDDHGHPIIDDPNHKHTAACFVDFEPLAVAELFQSQGCQACLAAVPSIQDGANLPNVLLLTYNISLFDHLGWKDTLASAPWDQRHRQYNRKWNRTSLFTPQVVANGIADGSGANGKSEVAEIVNRARTAQKAVDWHIYVDANDAEVRVDSDRQEAEPHDIVVIVYRANDETVKVGGGPNKGKKLKHRHVVVSATKIGEWKGGNTVASLPVARPVMEPGLDAVVVVQQGGGGPIIAANKI